MARKAVATGNRAARSAGKEAPIRPMASDHSTATQTTCGVTVS